MFNLQTVVEKAATLGHPSYVWTSGLERRLRIVASHIDLREKSLLDIGCGVGTFLLAFGRFTSHAYGIDVDVEHVREARRARGMVGVAISEQLPFPDDTFDRTFLHEVIEHVADDRATAQEACRVTKPGGVIILFAPNRLYPFETHGCYLGKRYYFGLVPLVNYLPDPLRRRFCPHVRAYTANGIRRLFTGLPVRLIVHHYVYPGFDGIARRSGGLAHALRFLYALEGTPLAIFGLSHLLILRKTTN
ncbi:MAG: class I SAM-dependent methyltransferase [Chloroflexi bacterium]|nr:class I SAM-dependent methyltransferase [Chloroflexota bacterium]